ncbi:helix-turn-helix domain-containing protein [Bradyrhizobium sp. UFLA 03-164]|uniref:Helix-turn-helix domain-containing protein n=1 Tax=Bradyrhizobium uaiense TaxID=2594946 RepID=A0A6P1BIW9_9BRAD|nr:helix-turn-helix domain-containing protein [Bradyrhizobium uaiense]
MAQDSAGTDNRRVIQVVSRAFDIVRCFEGRSIRLGNREIADRCGLPRSTVSRLTLTLTQIGQLIYLPQEQKYALGPHAAAPGAPLLAESRDNPACADERARETAQPSMLINARYFDDQRNPVAGPLAVTPQR